MKITDKSSLWRHLETLPVGDPHFDFSAASLGSYPLLKQLLDMDSGHLTEFYQEGAVKQEADSENEKMSEPVSEKYAKYFSGLGGRLIYKDLKGTGPLGPGEGGNCIYLWKDGIVETTVSGTYVSVHAFSHNEDFVGKIKDYMATQWAPVERTGHIYAIIRQGMHLGLSSIGNAGIPLVEGNYTPKVMEDYKYVIRDLQSESPSGRITVMRGPAGTGKTHLIRAMLLEVPDAMFVLISPEIVTNLAGPELLPLLMNYRGASTGPIVLILEDADKCLVARESTDMNSIQALLNLGDGILGSLLDMRIVATTNADEFKMDPAILRPGRLSKMLDVGHLDFETARNVFLRLLPDAKAPSLANMKFNVIPKEDAHTLPDKLVKDNPHKPLQMTLAEVYALARRHGWASALREVQSDDEADFMNYDE